MPIPDPKNANPRRKRFRLAGVVMALMISAGVSAQVSLRMLPPDARKGEMQPPDQGRVLIDGKTYMLAPGLRLRDTSNVIIFPHTVKRPATVRFTTDAMGLVDKVWILTPQEVAMPNPPQPTYAPAR